MCADHGGEEARGRLESNSSVQQPQITNICCFSAPSRSRFEVFQMIARKRGNTSPGDLNGSIIPSLLPNRDCLKIPAGTRAAQHEQHAFSWETGELGVQPRTAAATDALMGFQTLTLNFCLNQMTSMTLHSNHTSGGKQVFPGLESSYFLLHC